jgi:hypothetical protein
MKATSFLFVGGFNSGVAAYLLRDGAEDYARDHLHAMTTIDTMQYAKTRSRSGLSV